jgi:hypothetical protein
VRAMVTVLIMICNIGEFEEQRRDFGTDGFLFYLNKLEGLRSGSEIAVPII